MANVATGSDPIHVIQPGLIGSDGNKLLPKSTTPAPKGSGTVTAGDAHNMLIALGVESLIVFLLVLLAGVGPKASKTVIAFLSLLILMQGLGHVNPFISWWEAHPLTPVQPKGNTSA